MATKAAYQSRQKTKEKISALITKTVSQGGKALLSERKLAELTGGSRTIVHRILKELEKDGQLEQLSKGRIVNADASKIPALFITMGRNIAINPAWMRLWMAFAERAVKSAIAPELALIGYWPEEIERDLQKIRNSSARYIVITSPDDLPEDILNKWKTEKRNIIVVDEGFIASGFSVIGLDNFKAGELAAQTIAEKGFRKPGYFFESGYRDKYTPFQKRLDGFIAGAAKYGLNLDQENNIYRTSNGKIQSYIEQIKQIAYRNGIDSLFISSDNHITIFLDLLKDCGYTIPDDLGIMTLNAQNFAAVSGVDCISHATYEVAEALVENIQKHAQKEIEKIKTVLIKPTVHKGETLCRRK